MKPENIFQISRMDTSNTTAKKEDLLKYCVFCKKGFLKSYSLSRHLHLHTGAKPFRCPQCGYGFIQKSDLQRHLAIHSEVFSFECELKDCGRKFRTKRNLRSHQGNAHFNRGSYPCNKCPKVFETNSSLRFHLMKIHDIENRYSCDHCGKRFSLKMNLYAHFRLIRSTESLGKYSIRCLGSIKRDNFSYQSKFRESGEVNKSEVMKFKEVKIEKYVVIPPAEWLEKVKSRKQYHKKTQIIPTLNEPAWKFMVTYEESASIETVNRKNNDREFLLSFLPHLRTLNQNEKNSFKENVRLIIDKVLKD